MPTYSYKCTVCGHQFDVHQSFTDEALTVCPHCEGRLRKVFSPVGVTFKGSGFYRTDSRSGSGTKHRTSHSSSTSTTTSASTESSSTSSPSTSSGGSGSSGGSTSSGGSGTSGSSSSPAA